MSDWAALSGLSIIKHSKQFVFLAISAAFLNICKSLLRLFPHSTIWKLLLLSYTLDFKNLKSLNCKSFSLKTYIVLHVALVEHIKEACRANHDQGGKYDAVEDSLQVGWSLHLSISPIITWTNVEIASATIRQQPFSLELERLDFAERGLTKSRRCFLTRDSRCSCRLTWAGKSSSSSRRPSARPSGWSPWSSASPPGGGWWGSPPSGWLPGYLPPSGRFFHPSHVYDHLGKVAFKSG